MARSTATTRRQMQAQLKRIKRAMDTVEELSQDAMVWDMDWETRCRLRDGGAALTIVYLRLRGRIAEREPGIR